MRTFSHWMAVAIALVLFTSVDAFAARAKRYVVTDDTDAVITVRAPGQTPYITIDGQTYFLVAGKGLYGVSEDLDAILGNNRFHGQTQTVPGTAIGIVSGNTFKALVLEFALPRGLKPQN